VSCPALEHPQHLGSKRKWARHKVHDVVSMPVQPQQHDIGQNKPQTVSPGSVPQQQTAKRHKGPSAAPPAASIPQLEPCCHLPKHGYSWSAVPSRGQLSRRAGHKPTGTAHERFSCSSCCCCCCGTGGRYFSGCPETTASIAAATSSAATAAPVSAVHCAGSRPSCPSLPCVYSLRQSSTSKGMQGVACKARGRRRTRCHHVGPLARRPGNCQGTPQQLHLSCTHPALGLLSLLLLMAQQWYHPQQLLRLLLHVLWMLQLLLP
jgi:hypothetical protein